MFSRRTDPLINPANPLGCHTKGTSTCPNKDQLWARLGDIQEIFNAFALIGLSTLKFVIVVGWFMHLRYEKPMLTRFFTAGFVLAVGLYLVVLSALGVVAIRGG